MERYTKIRVLGKGSFGSAILIKRRSDNALLVIKEVFLGKMSKKEREEARHECRVLQKLSHPNIVRYVEHFENRDNLYIVMEYCDGGDLHGKLKMGPMKESTILYYYSQICLAMEYLHSRHILHRDIKTMNVFLMKNGSAKLGDFGISTVLRNTMGMANTMCGTPYYFSPEICRNKPYNNKSDVWALGVLLYEMATGKHPFDGSSMQQLMQRIVKGTYPPLPSHFSSEFRNVVDWCLQKDPSRRPSIKQTLALPIIRRSLEQLEENLMLATQCKVRLKDIIDFEVGGEHNDNNNNHAVVEPVKQGGVPLRCASPYARAQGISPGKAAAMAVAKQQNELQRSPQRSQQPLSPGAEAAVGLLAQRPAGNLALLSPKPTAAAAAIDLNRIQNYRKHLLQQCQSDALPGKAVPPAPVVGGKGAGAAASPTCAPPPTSPLSSPRHQQQQQHQQQRNLPPTTAEYQNQFVSEPSRQKPAAAAAVFKGFQERMQRVNAIMQRYAQNVDPKSRETIHAYMKRKQDEYLQRQKQEQECVQRRQELRKKQLAKVIEHQNLLARGDLPLQQRQKQRQSQQNNLTVQGPAPAANSLHSPRMLPPQMSPPPQSHQPHLVLGRDPRWVQRQMKEAESPASLQPADPVRNSNDCHISNHPRERKAKVVVRGKRKVFAANSPILFYLPMNLRHQSLVLPPREDAARPFRSESAAVVAPGEQNGNKGGNKGGNMPRKLTTPQVAIGGVGLCAPTKGRRSVEDAAPHSHLSVTKGPPPVPHEKQKPQSMLRIISAPVFVSQLVNSNAAREESGEDNEDDKGAKKNSTPTHLQVHGLVRRSSAPSHRPAGDSHTPFTNVYNPSKVFRDKQIIRPLAAAGFMPQGITASPQQHHQYLLSRAASPTSGLVVMGARSSFVSKDDLHFGVEELRQVEQRRRQFLHHAETDPFQEEQPGKSEEASLPQALNAGAEFPNNNRRRRKINSQPVANKTPLPSDITCTAARGNPVNDKPRKKEIPPPVSLAPLQIRLMQPGLLQGNSPTSISSPFKLSGVLPPTAARAPSGKQPLSRSAGCSESSPQVGIGQMPAVVGVRMSPHSREPGAGVSSGAAGEIFSSENFTSEEPPVLLDIDYGFSSMAQDDGAKQSPVAENGSTALFPSITDVGLEQADVLQQWRNVADGLEGHKIPHRVTFIHRQTGATKKTFGDGDDVLAAFQKASRVCLSVPSTLEVLRTLCDRGTEETGKPLDQPSGVSLTLLKQKHRRKQERVTVENQPNAAPMGLPLPLYIEGAGEQRRDETSPPISQPISRASSQENTNISSEACYEDLVAVEGRPALVTLVDSDNEVRGGSNELDRVNHSTTSVPPQYEQPLEGYLEMLDHLRGILYRGLQPSKKLADAESESKDQTKEEDENEESEMEQPDKASLSPVEGKERSHSVSLKLGMTSTMPVDDLPTPHSLLLTKVKQLPQDQPRKPISFLLANCEGNPSSNGSLDADEVGCDDNVEDESDEEDNDDDFEDAIPLLAIPAATVSENYRRILEDAYCLPEALSSQDAQGETEVNSEHASASGVKPWDAEEDADSKITDNASPLPPGAAEKEPDTNGGCTVTTLNSVLEASAVKTNVED
ncbi:putative protein kinase, putative,serine/threonine-protein kinase Nek1 [Trypanosoma rangeli]|uniref:non-specific serine/threonine protein kinase n=1 Tax=Trypanosoma rangeli TaxID=5698 RepID=A0A3R7MUC4_TRYRA|nr:putative protein kinase, putative,serine/threonine-protein kinase Nek1 [Trypanosoma rangeli]RNF11389.1 putative protein kinase, putative,serine/threonine-protein kinase Nek1 [Trypanosoma rangeli]|eukprot:RNF11389.1 putative protein kinase, putative,serine/threonine-protein kinase Nek1 [Trypanosoma rangeli]